LLARIIRVLMRCILYTVLHRGAGPVQGILRLPKLCQAGRPAAYTAADVIARVEAAEELPKDTLRGIPHVVVSDGCRTVRDAAVVVAPGLKNGGARSICIAEILPASRRHISYAE